MTITSYELAIPGENLKRVVDAHISNAHPSLALFVRTETGVWLPIRPLATRVSNTGLILVTGRAQDDLFGERHINIDIPQSGKIIIKVFTDLSAEE